MFRRFRIIIPLLCALFCLVLVLGFASAAFAAGEAGSFFSQVGGKLGEGANIVIGAILSIWTLFAGGLLILFTKGLLFVAQFNQFVGAEAVSLGWKIVRDICNMFFVLVLLIIAIGTILQVEKYHYSKLLPQFITMAIMINFSKTICGVLIDAAQVVMLTFVGAFSGAAGGNLFALLGLHQLWTVVGEKAGAASAEKEGALLGTFLLVAVFVTIADVVVFVMLMVLIARIVMLWFLIVLSPFAFILSVLPGAAQKYAGQWWSEFTNYVIVGPAMAFFLWLSLAVVAKTGDKADITKYNVSDAVLKDKEGQQFSNKQTDFTTNSAGVDVGTTAIGTLSGMLSYVLGIGMLMGTLMVAQQLGVAGGKMAGAAVGGINDVLSGKRGPLPLRAMAGTAWSTFEGKQMDLWKKRGERIGNVGARLADSSINKLNLSKSARAEAQTRIEAHKEETTKRKMDNFAKAGDFAKLTPQELRNQLGKEKNGMRRAALVNEINKRGELGNEKGDTDLIATQAKFLEANGGAHMMVEFDDQIKKSNLTAAFDAGRFNDEHGNLSIDKFFAELKMGKFSSESVTDAMLKTLGKKNDADAEAGVAQKRAQLEKDIKSKDPEKRAAAQKQLDELKKQQLTRSEAQEKREKAVKATRDLRAESDKKKKEMEERVKAIKETAKAEKRKLTKDEEKEIGTLKANVGKLDAQAASKDREALKQDQEEKNAKAAAYEMAGHKMLGNRLVEGMKDAKQISSIVGSLSTNTWRSLEKNTSLLKGVTDEQRIAFARSKGAYELSFDVNNEVDQEKLRAVQTKKTEDLTDEDKGLMESHRQQELFRDQILSKGEKRDEFYKIIDKQSASNKNIWKIVSENNDWKAAYAQRVALYRDAEKKDAIKASVGELVEEYNKHGEEKGEDETIREVRMRNLLHGVSRQNQYVSADGQTKDIYDARGESRADEILRKKHKIKEDELAGMKWEDKLVKLSDEEKEQVAQTAENARHSYKIQVSHDRLQADELEDQNWSNSGASDESKEMFLEAYSSEQQRKIIAVNKELSRKMLEYRKTHLEKTTKEHMENIARAEQDLATDANNIEKQNAFNAAKEAYKNWKKGEVATSNRMAKGDNTYTGLPVFNEADTNALFDSMETPAYKGPAASVAETPVAPTPSAPAPAASPTPRRREGPEDRASRMPGEQRTAGGIIAPSSYQRPPQPSPRAPQQPEAQPPEDDDINNM